MLALVGRNKPRLKERQQVLVEFITGEMQQLAKFVPS